MLAPRWPPLHGREILLAPNTVAASHARETITPALPPGAPCNWSSLPSARESLQAFDQSMRCQDKTECRCYAHRSGSFCGSLRSSIGGEQRAREQRTEFGSRSSEARHHCASRTAQQAGDLLVGQLSILSQHDDLAKLLGKFLDRLSYLIALHFAHIKSMWTFGWFHGHSCRALVHIELDDLGRGTPLSHLIEPDVS